MNNIAHRQGIQYCRIDESTAVIFNRIDSEYDDGSVNTSINVEIINTKSNEKYDIRYFINKQDAILILNNWMSYVENIRNTIASRFDECTYFISRARRTLHMINDSINNDELNKYKKYLKKLEREEFFRIKMVDTEKEKEEKRKLELEESRARYREQALITKESYSEQTITSKTPYIHRRYHSNLTPANMYHVYMEETSTSINKIMDAYNEYCESEVY